MDLITVVCYILFAVALLACAFLAPHVPLLCARLRALYLLRRVPGPKARSLVHGHLVPGELSHTHRMYQEWALEYGPVIAFRAAYIPAVIVTDPTLMPPLFKLPRSFVYRDLEILTLHRPNIFTRSNMDPVWKATRKAVAKVFMKTNLQRHFPSALARAQSVTTACWAEAAASGAPIDMVHSIKVLLVHILGDVAFELDLAAPSRQAAVTSALDAMLHTLKEVQERACCPLRKYSVWEAGVRQGAADVSEWNALITAFADEAMSAQREEGQVESSEPDTRSIVAALRSARLADGSRLPREQAVAEIATFFFVGTDTTSNTLAWTLLLLSQHPACRARVAAELQAAGLKATGDKPARPLTFADLSKLPYINACLQESMRLEPTVAVGTWRDADRDLLVGGHLVPKGTLIGMPFYATFTSPDNFPDAMRYDPDRWLAPAAPYAPVTVSASNQGLAKRSARAPAIPGPSSTAAPAAPGCPFAAAVGGLEADTERSGEICEGGCDGAAVCDAKCTREYPQQSYPFSLGDRNCVGRGLAQMEMTLFMATLFSRFDVELASNLNTVAEIYAAEDYASTSGPPFLHMRISAAA